MNARRDALFALALWKVRGAFPAQALAPGEGHAFALELLGATLRHKASLEWMVRRCVARMPEGELWAALMIGAAQLFCLPAVADHAAVAETVEAAKPIGRQAAKFVNAVLRRLQRERETLLADLAAQPEHLRLNVPKTLWTRWCAALGVARARAVAEALAVPPRVCVRPLPPHAPPPGCEPHPDDPTGTFLVPRGVRVETLEGFAEGHFVVQDAATRHAIELLDVRPGQRVLDACAAPGGKSVQIAARLAGQGLLVANEPVPERAAKLKDTLARCAGRTDVRPTQHRFGGMEGWRDGGAECGAPPHAPTPPRLHASMPRGGEAAAPIPPSLQPSIPPSAQASERRSSERRASASLRLADAPFQRILLDVPCSNTGVFGRRPDARWTWSKRKLAALVETQAALLDEASAFLAPGGRLVYSTCSIEPEEDADQVAAFLARHPDFTLERSVLDLPTPLHDGAYAAALLRRQ